MSRLGGMTKTYLVGRDGHAVFNFTHGDGAHPGKDFAQGTLVLRIQVRDDHERQTTVGCSAGKNSVIASSPPAEAPMPTTLRLGRRLSPSSVGGGDSGSPGADSAAFSPSGVEAGGWIACCSSAKLSGFSEPSDYAFRLACSLARDYRAQLIVLHVLERPLRTYSGVLMAPPPLPPSEEERQTAREQLQRINAPDPAIEIKHLFEEGDPATAILQVAQEHSCELIVMGSHGRTGLGRLLMGSVAEQVVRKASCPVLTVKTPQQPVPPSKEPTTVTAGQGVQVTK